MYDFDRSAVSCAAREPGLTPARAANAVACVLIYLLSAAVLVTSAAQPRAAVGTPADLPLILTPDPLNPLGP